MKKQIVDCYPPVFTADPAKHANAAGSKASVV